MPWECAREVELDLATDGLLQLRRLREHRGKVPVPFQGAQPIRAKRVRPHNFPQPGGNASSAKPLELAWVRYTTAIAALGVLFPPLRLFGRLCIAGSL